MSNIELFESSKIRSIWDKEEQKWYFSIIDVVAERRMPTVRF